MTRFVFLFYILSSAPLAFAQAVCDGVAPVAASDLRSVEVVNGLPGSPLLVTAPPGDTDRLFIVTKNGEIRIWKRGTPSNQHTVFLDIAVSTQNERGLLGLAFDPDYATNRYFYVYYTDPSGDSRVERYEAEPSDPDLADPDSALLLLTLDQPSANHNAGHLTFGPDGYLYIATGDGGGGGDPWGECGNAQNRENLFGAILRIDPNATTSGAAPDCGSGGYRIPAGNAFSDGSGGNCDEIFAWGLRNPWRFDVDPATGDLYIGDVGQSCREEIDYVAAANAGGTNFGWRSKEGSRCFNPQLSADCDPDPVACTGTPTCGDPSLTDPIHEYGRTTGRSVTGGVVYRGCRLDGYDGVYFFGDKTSGRVWSFRVVGGAMTEFTERSDDLDPNNTLVDDLYSFGRDAQGEIYLLDGPSGRVRKIVPPFAETQLSAPGATPFGLGPAGWSWQDVNYDTMVPIDYYRVYRGQPGATFSCVHAASSPQWIPGDNVQPAPGQLLAYLVTAVDTAGEESSPGAGRQLTAPCPAP